MNCLSNKKRIAIVGTVGLPSNYGGFETLAENLIIYHDVQSLDDPITVYCSSSCYKTKSPYYRSARLIYIPFHANGIQSIFYDIISLFLSVLNRTDVIFLLGVSGAIVLPLIRLLSSAQIITNIDGMEWRRDKWRWYASYFLKTSEKIAVLYSHKVISDNDVIAEYVRETYGVNSHVIAYGGDHAVSVDAVSLDEYKIPSKYAFAVCRIEPENNMSIILDAFSRQELYSLVIVGNWNRNAYGRALLKKYEHFNHIFLLDPIYDLGKLKTLRSEASIYIHGHSAGGTNPSLVEAMHFGIPIVAFDCDFNRSTTEGKALFFHDAQGLLNELISNSENFSEQIGKDMFEIARRRYCWETISAQYFSLIRNTDP